jgi:hypothetical protein
MVLFGRWNVLKRLIFQNLANYLELPILCAINLPIETRLFFAVAKFYHFDLTVKKDTKLFVHSKEN